MKTSIKKWLLFAGLFAGFASTVNAVPPPLTPSDFQMYMRMDTHQTNYLGVAIKIVNPSHPAHPSQSGGATRIAWDTSTNPPGGLVAATRNKGIKSTDFADVGVWEMRNASEALASWVDRSTQINDTLDVTVSYTLDPLSVPAASAVWSSFSVRVPITIYQPTDIKSYPQMDADEWNAVNTNPGYVFGDAGQYIMDAAQCWSHPEVVYAVQDTGGARTSIDHGQTWYTLPNHGLLSNFMNGVAVDPLNQDHVLAIANPNKTGDDIAGLYATFNGGLNWTRKITNANNTLRGRTPLVDFARSTMNSTLGYTTRAYCIMQAWDVDNGAALPGNPPHKLYYTNDGGLNWTYVRDLASTTYGRLYRLTVNPNNPDKIFLSGDHIWRIDNATTSTGTITKISGSGGLPDKGVSGSFYVSSNGLTLLAGLSGSGLYRSTDAGVTWTQTYAQAASFTLFIDPFDASRMVMMFAKNAGVLKYCTNGASAAATFTDRVSAPSYPGATTDGPLDESYGHALWLSSTNNTVIVHSRTKWWRSTDNGANWALSTAGYNGRNHTNFRPGAQFFDPTNADRFVMPMVDYGLRYTTTRGRSFDDTAITAAMVTAQTVTCNGAAIHPNPAKQKILVAASEQSKQVLLYSPNNGTSFTVVGATKKRRQFVGYDRDNPSFAFNADEMSSDEGASWNPVSFLTTNSAVVWDMTYNEPASTGEAIFAIDLEGTAEKVWRSTNQGTSWTLVLQTSYSLRPESTLFNMPFKVHPTDKNIIWTMDSTKQKLRKWDLTSGTATTRPYTDYELTTLDGPVPSTFTVLFIDIDPHTPSVMYAVGYGENSGAKLWRSTDSGANWNNMSNYLAGITYKGMAISPVTGEVFISSPTGGLVIPPPYTTTNTVGAQLPWTGNYNFPRY